MPKGPRKLRPWLAAVIVSVFMLAVAASAAVGWWFARESPAHQGPIVLISVDGLPAASLSVDGEPRTDTPAIDLLASEGVVFDRAYAQSPQLLPAHASILSGQLPLQHGVRNDAGFTLKDEIQTLPEILRSRGFSTGAAVSSFLLRPETGVGQGFRFYDAEIPESADVDAPVLARGGAETLDAAEAWMRTQNGRRFFLFVQVDQRDADAAVTRLSASLRSRGLYDGATIVLVGERGELPSQTLDDAALRVPLIVKQPGGEGAGRRVTAAVQQIDLAPTLLDLVRAPVPNALSGRSLRGVLTDEEATLRDRPLYAEWLGPHYGFGGYPVYVLTTSLYRYVRGADEDLVPIAPVSNGGSGAAAETARLRAELDRLVGTSAPPPPEPIAPAEEERLAFLGYLASPRLRTLATPLSAVDQALLAGQHRAAALLIGQKRYSSGIRALQAIVDAHPELEVVQYQLGSALMRSGRLDEAIALFQEARDRQPEQPDVALGLADALMRAGRIELAAKQADDATALAQVNDTSTRAAAHQLAARIALARNDVNSATEHAKAAQEADPTLPIEQFVRGRLLYEEGKYEEAAKAFQEAAAAAKTHKRSIPDLYLYLGESLAHLDRFSDAEAQYREELRAFPRNVQVYSRLAMLYAATNREGAVEDVLNELVAATPTPESYAVAARLWTIVGNRSRAEALRSDARARFRGDPSLALLGKDGRR
jgi:tetratricopeptide (TPR) repeat protein